MWFLIGVLILIIFIIGSYLYLKYKLKRYLNINIPLNEIINNQKLIEENIPKSVGSMDRLYLENIKKDFPDININEIKRMAEKEIITYFNAIESKNVDNIKIAKIKELAKSKIKDLKDKTVEYNNIKFHNTVLNKYENNNGIATITIASSIEYLYKETNEEQKVQNRLRVEYIYIYDTTKVEHSKKVLGLNCPNCGSPINSLKNTVCEYCHTKVIGIVKKVWTCNNIEEY